MPQTVIPAPQPSFRHPNRHSGASRNLAALLDSGFRRSDDPPAKPPKTKRYPACPGPFYSHAPTVIPTPQPSFRRKPESSQCPRPSFRHPNRHSGASRNLAALLDSGFRRSDDPPAKPPKTKRYPACPGPFYSRTTTVIPPSQPSFPHHNRHSRTPTVIPAQAGIQKSLRSSVAQAPGNGKTNRFPEHKKALCC